MNKANRATTSQKSKTGSVYEMYLENVGAGGVSQVHNYARDLTLMSPISVSLIDQKSGRWLVGFDSKINFLQVGMNLSELKKRGTIPYAIKFTNPGIREVQKPSGRVNQRPYILVVTLNSLLKSVLLADKQIWKSELNQKLDKVAESKIELIERNSKLRITPKDQTKNPRMCDSEWKRKMSQIVNEFETEFGIETLKIDNQVKSEIEEAKELYPIEFKSERDRVTLMGHRANINAFFTQYPHLRNAEENKENKPTGNQKRVIMFNGQVSLIEQLVQQVNKTYPLTNHFILCGNRLEVIASSEIINQVDELLRKCVSSIKSKHIDDIKPELLRCANLNAIIKAVLTQSSVLISNMAYGLSVNANGIFIDYFFDIPELGWHGDFVFKQISDLIVYNVGYDEIDVTDKLHLIHSIKWKAFVDKNMNEKLMKEDNFSFTLSSMNLNRRAFIILVGGKNYIAELRSRINEYFEENGNTQSSISITQDQYDYLAEMGRERFKSIESKYEIKVSPLFNQVNQSYELRVENCPNSILRNVEREIKYTIAPINSITYTTTPALPGLLKAYEETEGFKSEIKSIESESLACIKAVDCFESTQSQSEKKTELYVPCEFYQAKFKIIYPNETSRDKAMERLDNIVRDKHILRELVSINSLDKLNQYSLMFLCNQISQKFAGSLTMTIDKAYKRAIIHGNRADVQKAHLELIRLVNSHLESEKFKMENQVKMARDIQWQYKLSENEWKSFPFYLNSLIESKHSSTEPFVTFETESLEQGRVYFTSNPILFIVGNRQYSMRRVDLNKFQETKSDNTIVYPENWSNESKISSKADFKLVSLPPNSPEYLEIYHDFLIKLGRTPSSCTIERIENRDLFGPYYLYKCKLIKQNDGFDNEMNLFHGTSRDSIEKITKFGFNRSYCGKNGVLFGQGVYFAREASYSERYCAGGGQMIRARVLVGHTCQGNSSTVTPPVRTGNILYDSTGNGSSIFVCYHDNQCYPEYLITFS